MSLTDNPTVMTIGGICCPPVKIIAGSLPSSPIPAASFIACDFDATVFTVNNTGQNPLTDLQFWGAVNVEGIPAVPLVSGTDYATATQLLTDARVSPSGSTPNVLPAGSTALICLKLGGGYARIDVMGSSTAGTTLQVGASGSMVRGSTENL